MGKLRVVIPKGRISENVVKLLDDAGVSLRMDERVYRPTVSDPEIEVKIMKPQNISKLVELGRTTLNSQVMIGSLSPKQMCLRC